MCLCVSILVVVDLSFRHSIGEVLVDLAMVSILVVVDLSFRHNRIELLLSLYTSFNPCCGGFVV